MIVLPCSTLMRPFLMKLGSVLGSKYFRGIKSTFQRGEVIFRLLWDYHKAKKADEVCAGQGTEPGPNGGY